MSGRLYAASSPAWVSSASSRSCSGSSRAAPAGTPLAGDTRAEAVARFSDEASRIAAKPVTIRCDESRDYVGLVQHADGVAAVGGDRAYLTPERCLDLYRLAFEGEVTSSQTARALAVLAHEAWHLRGVSDEGTTECYALQSGVEIGQRLGLSDGTARQMMRQQLVGERAAQSGSLRVSRPAGLPRRRPPRPRRERHKISLRYARNPPFPAGFAEADERARTVDLLHGKQTLYQLSYIREGGGV